MLQRLNLISSCLISIFLISCGGGDTGSTTPNGNIVPISSNHIYLSQMSTMPMTNQSNQFYMQLNNNTNLALSLNNISTNNLISSKSQSLVVDATNCQNVVAGGMCTIKITPNDLDGGALIKLTFIDSNNIPYTVSKTIKYSSTIQNVNGFYYTADNAFQVANKGDNVAIAIPFVLADDYDTVTTDLPQIANIICNGATGVFTNGEAFTLFINVKADNINGVVNLSGVNKLRSITNTAQVNYSININHMANLITDASNLIINPADSIANETVHIVNTGLAPANIQQIIADNSAIIIGNDGCSLQSLANNSSCSFQVKALSNQYGNGLVTINYGSNSLKFNVSYYSTGVNPHITFTSSGNLLANIPIALASNEILTILNDGNIDLNTLVLPTSALSQITYSTSGISNQCVNGQALAIDQSCNIDISYAPTSIESGVFNYLTIFNYINESDTPQSYTVTDLIPYSSVSHDASIIINPNSTNFTIKADGVDVESMTFTLTNIGTYQTMVENITLPNHISLVGADNCTGKTLAANGGTCNLVLQLNPQTTSLSESTALIVSYKRNPFSTPITVASLINNQAKTVAIIKISLESATVNWLMLGNGSLGSPYQFEPSNSNQLRLTYQYSNVGNDTARNFNISANKLPVGYTIESHATTCAYGINNISPLNIASSCLLVLRLVDPSLQQYLHPTGVMNLIPPSANYTDVLTGVNMINFVNATTYINANPWGMVNIESTSVIKNTNGTQNITFVFKLASLSSYLLSHIGLPITVIPDMSKAYGITLNNPSCTINSVSGTCTITGVASNYAPAPNSYIIPYQYKYSTPSDGDARTAYVSFNLQ